MNQNFLVIYDYFLLSDNSEHFGINNILLKYLNDKKVNLEVIKHKISANPIYLLSTKLPDILKTLNKTSFDTVIAYNCVNALLTAILKFILRKKFKLIFVSLDFTKKRFGNFFLDKLYLLVDYLASKFSDEIWNSSLRVYEYRNSFVNKSKNFYIPNLPNYQKENLPKFDKFSILMISFLNKTYSFDQVLETFDYIKEKDLNLFIVGEGEMKEEIQKIINEKNLQKNIFLTGYLNHNEVRKLLEKTHLGLAIYGGVLDFNFWGDSLKIREYTYYNLPVITNKNVYNWIEVEKENLGLIIDENNSLLNLIKKLFEDKELYKKIINSTFEYNKKFSIEELFKSRLGF